MAPRVKVVDVVSPSEEVKPDETKEPKEESSSEEVVAEIKDEPKTEEPKVVAPKPKRAPPKPKVKEELPPPPESPPPEPPKKEKALDQLVKCDKCNKEMKLKSLRYSHKCGEEAPPPKRAPQQAIAPSPKPEPIAVSFDDLKTERTNRFAEMRNQRMQIKQQRVKHLISQAI
jgi:hypothetical protein